MTHYRIYMLVLVAISAFVLMAGAGCDDNPVKSDPHAPSIKLRLYPANGAVEQPLSISFIWSSFDPDGDPLSYYVYFGTGSSPVLVASELIDTNYTIAGLDYATSYYWQIVAKDSTGRRATTGTRSFTTFSWVYPLAVGNRWAYSEVIEIITVGPDTTDLPEYDTAYGISHIDVASLDSLSDSLVAYRIHASLNQDSTIYDSDTWFNNVDDGLFVFSSQGTGLLAIPNKIEPGMTFTLLGQQFNSLDEILATISGTLASPPAFHSSVDLEGSPVRSLQYPLAVGSQWTVRTAHNPWSLDKLVTGQEQIEVPAGQFSAFQIRWLYDLDADGNWDEEVFVVDHIANVGLVKRVISVSGIVFSSPWGDSASYGEFTQVIQLSGYSLK